MKLLLTGASGRLGRAIHAATAAAFDVVGTDRVPGPATRLVGDLADLRRMASALDGAGVLVHTAALHAPQVGLEPDAEFERVNVQATRALVEAAVRAGVRRVLYTSTTALYGAGSTEGPAEWVDEDTVPRPRTVYHRTKLAAETLLEELAARHRLSLTILRVGRCFDEPPPLMAAYRLHRGLDLRDAATAHALALRREMPGVRRFVISGAPPFTRDDAEALGRDAAALIRERLPALAAAFEARGWPLPARLDRVYDPARAMSALGWRPQHGPEAVMA